MSAEYWTETQYRLQVWEEAAVVWPAGKIRAVHRPQPGDRMFCWYAKTGSTAPGLCGWGVVLNYEEPINQISWRPVFPSDLLKMVPLINTGLVTRINSVRGKFKQATMWPVDADTCRWLADEIRAQLSARPDGG